MTVGPYGILRGLGIKEKKALTHLNNWDKGNYFCLVKDYVNELKILENELKKIIETG